MSRVSTGRQLASGLEWSYDDEALQDKAAMGEALLDEAAMGDRLAAERAGLSCRGGKGCSPGEPSGLSGPGSEMKGWAPLSRDW